MTRAEVGRSVGWTLKLLVLSLLAIELLYVVVGNLVLSTGWLGRIVSRNPDVAGLDYASAWTVVPGWIRARDVELHMQDSTVQWALRIDHADLHVEIGELFSRKIHLTKLAGDGLVFRLRIRIPPNAMVEPRAGTLPPIPGYADALRAMGPDRPPPTDEEYDLWTAQVAGIDAEVREIWIEEYRWVGSMHAEGGFYLKPLRRALVSTSSFEIRSGEITLGAHTVATATEGQIVASFAPFDPRGVDRGLLRNLTARVATSGQTPNLDFVGFYLGEGSPVKLADGSGVVETNVGVVSGVAVPESTVKVRTSRLDVRAPGVTTSVGGEVTWRAGPERGELVADVSHATFYRSRSKAPPASADGVRLEVGTPVDLAGPMTLGPATLDVRSAKIPDIRWLEGEEPSSDDVRLTGGSAELSGKLQVTAEGKPSGTARVALDRAGFEWAGVKVEGYAKGSFDLVSADPHEKSVRMTSRAEVRDVAIRHGSEVWPGWWASVVADPMEIRAGSPPTLAVTLATKCRDARAVTEILVGRGVLPGWVADLMEMEGAAATARIVQKGERIDVTLHRAKGKGAAAAGRVIRRSATDVRGAFVVKKGPLAAGIAFKGGHKTFRPAADNEWLEREIRELE